MLEGYKVAASMLALGEFTADELAKASKVALNTVRTYLSRKRHLLEKIGEDRTGRPGGQKVRFRIREDQLENLRSEVRSVVGAVAPRDPFSEHQRPSPVPVATRVAEDTLLHRYPAATDVTEKEYLLDLAGAALQSGHLELKEFSYEAPEARAEIDFLEGLRRVRAAELSVQSADMSDFEKCLDAESQLLEAKKNLLFQANTFEALGNSARAQQARDIASEGLRPKRTLPSTSVSSVGPPEEVDPPQEVMDTYDTYRIISSDSHFVEPPNMWSERIDQRFREHAPHTVRNYENREGEFFICENIQPVAVAGFFVSTPNVLLGSAGFGKTSLSSPSQLHKRGFDAAPKSVWDPAERLKEQDSDGVTGEILYPSMGTLLFGLNDVELRNACFSIFNDWAAEYCSYNPRRLIGMGIVALEDVSFAIRELERCAKKGLRGILISSSPPQDTAYSDTSYDPFWAAAQDLGMPISLHFVNGIPRMHFSGGFVTRTYMKLPNEIQCSFADLVFGGVLERFPRLKLISAENDISWLPHFCHRIDSAYDQLREVGAIALSIKPSEYMKRQVWATFHFETENVGFVLKKYGHDKLMWSSEYPHPGLGAHRWRDFIEKKIDLVNNELKHGILGDNVLHLYRIGT